MINVLVVEPDADTRLLVKGALAPLAASVSEAEDGAEALGKAICESPAVVVTEARLPRIDGVTLCGLLRRNPTTAAARIVVVTGATAPVVSRQAVAAGADAVLFKPYPPDELITTIRRLCGGSVDRRRVSR